MLMSYQYKPQHMKNGCTSYPPPLQAECQSNLIHLSSSLGFSVNLGKRLRYYRPKVQIVINLQFSSPELW